jgi:hypothetical protein|tara:strand:- start:337 stop:510 length:174 start_codon:yes stop_codon:yes gene_type:complete
MGIILDEMTLNNYRTQERCRRMDTFTAEEAALTLHSEATDVFRNAVFTDGEQVRRSF